MLDRLNIFVLHFNLNYACVKIYFLNYAISGSNVVQGLCKTRFLCTKIERICKDI